MGFGVQLQPGQVLRVAGDWGANKHQRRNPTLNGQTFLNQRKNFNGGVSAYCSGNSCTIEHPDMTVLLRNSPPYNDYTITLKKRGGKFHAAGRCFGTCGGLGRQQYGGQIRGANGGSNRYPCKTCVAGGAFRTVQCRCEEYGVPQDKSLVTSWKAVAREPIMPKLADYVDLPNHQEARQSQLIPQQLSSSAGGGATAHNSTYWKKCIAKFEHTTFMKVIFKECPAPKLDESGAAKCTGHHKKMAKEVKKLADGCAGDSKAANVEPEKMADDYEKNFCLICQSEAETNAHFAEEHCATIVSPCRKKYEEVVNAIEPDEKGHRHNPCAKHEAAPAPAH